MKVAPMEPQTHRATARTLAEDLDWLEEHCRKHPELAQHAAHLRLAGALTRNVIGPAVDGQGAKPLFVAVVGGAGAGKSTVVNFLTGAIVADANPQAGFTRHPTAFLPATLGGAWPSHLGFLGPLQRLTETKSANLDEDVYQVVRMPVKADGTDPLADVVLESPATKGTHCRTNQIREPDPVDRRSIRSGSRAIWIADGRTGSRA